MKITALLSFMVLIFTNGKQEVSDNYTVTKGAIQFKSEAPLELIEATSQDLKGIINLENGTFAFSININSFEGFNSGLQQEHFNENYMESDKFPRAVFSGKLIESLSGVQEGKHSVRAKGILNIHGIEQERIIRADVHFGKDGELYINSKFTVLLKDHNITIPKVVYQKISEEIMVDITAIAEQK